MGIWREQYADKRQPPPYLLPLLAYRLGVENKPREEKES